MTPVSTAAGPYNITLPPSQVAGQGRQYFFYTVTGGAIVTFIITVGSGDTLKAASVTINNANDKALWYSDGMGTWYRLI
jgi:hypothetical protein